MMTYSVPATGDRHAQQASNFGKMNDMESTGTTVQRVPSTRRQSTRLADGKPNRNQTLYVDKTFRQRG